MVSEDDVVKIASLAALEVEPEEIARLTADLNSILDFVRQLESLDTGDIEPMSHVHGFTNVLREDTILQQTEPGAILDGAPQRTENLIQVPLILEQGE